MHNLGPLSRLVALASLLVVGSGCSCSDESMPRGDAGPSDTGAESDSGDACPESGSGMLEIAITGLPAGVTPSVTVTGPAGTEMPTGTSTLSLDGGTYTVTADIVVGPADPIVRTAWAPTVEASGASGVCVRDGETVTVDVTYAAIPTSGKLWSHGTAPAPVVGFAAADLGASGSPEPAMAPLTRDAAAFTFDREGNLWIIGGTTTDPTLARYDADTVAAADRTAEIEVFVEGSGCSPGAQALAFDADGNLWLAILCDDQVVRLTPDQLAASGTVTADVVLGGVTAPKGLAFDAAGNLWVASDIGISQYEAAVLDASAAAPTLTLHIIATGDATAADPTALTFDASGDLWATVNANYNFARIAAPDLTGTGEADVVPAAYVSVGVSALPAGTAIDDSGALWFGATAGVVARLDPDQLTTSTTYAAPTMPAVRIMSDSVASSASVAFYPAAAGLPVFHGWP